MSIFTLKLNKTLQASQSGFLLGSLKTTCTSIIISWCVKVLDVKLLACSHTFFPVCSISSQSYAIQISNSSCLLFKIQVQQYWANYSPMNSPDFIPAFHSPIINLLICNKTSQTLHFQSVCKHYPIISDSGRGGGPSAQTSIRLHLALD